MFWKFSRRTTRCRQHAMVNLIASQLASPWHQWGTKDTQWKVHRSNPKKAKEWHFAEINPRGKGLEVHYRGQIETHFNGLMCTPAKAYTSNPHRTRINFMMRAALRGYRTIQNVDSVFISVSTRQYWAARSYTLTTVKNGEDLAASLRKNRLVKDIMSQVMSAWVE